jgi:UDP-glucose 4-epimerase
MEAVRTNVLGTQNVLDAATANGVKQVIVLSTDKAVYPINAMGISKAMAEKLMIAKSRSQSPTEAILCATRYGNVMASRGSVIPLFVSQIKAGRPLTVTDPEMTRFLMSLEDSVDLVEYAFENARPGDIFVQKSPGATVSDLAQALKEIFKSKSSIDIIGTRHGEKLYETLVSKEEILKAENLDKYYRIPSDNRDLNYGQYFNEGMPNYSNVDDYTSHNTQRLNVEQIKETLMKLDYVRNAL